MSNNNNDGKPDTIGNEQANPYRKMMDFIQEQKNSEITAEPKSADKPTTSDQFIAILERCGFPMTDAERGTWEYVWNNRNDPTAFKKPTALAPSLDIEQKAKEYLIKERGWSHWPLSASGSQIAHDQLEVYIKAFNAGLAHAEAQK